MKKEFYSFEQWCKDNEHEDWLDLWDYELNEKSPNNIAYKSGKKYWFKCPRGLHDSELKKLDNISCERSKIFCKQCRSFGQYLLDNFGSDAIDKFWSDKNKANPFDIYHGTNKKIWVKCCNDSTHPDYLISASNFCYGYRCSICGSRKVYAGINDVATTHPESVKYFNNPEDAKLISKGSERFIDAQCPDCGHVLKKRMCDIISFGFNCPKCGDGTSYPNKYVYEFLTQLQKLHDFDIYPEHVFAWSSCLWKNNKFRKIYDFYISDDIETIIEVHGYQHFTGSFYRYGHTVEYEVNNDIYKKELALKNGIHKNNYIVIDARKSDSNWMKESILNCGISLIYPFNEQDIDWNKCNQMACKSFVKIASDLWNDGIRSASKIAEIIGKSRGTVTAYLKTASDIGWCDYQTRNIKS